MTMDLACDTCGRRYLLSDLAWRCDCGGLLDLARFAPRMPSLEELRGRPATLWRYGEALPAAEPTDISMGEGLTPLVGTPQGALKLDYLMPSGSFKDRGAVLLVALARRLGVARVVADSSGNAGTAVAAYAARAGIACDVYVPAATSARKTAQLAAYGTVVHRIEGTREDTAAAAARAAAEQGVFYASHVYHPFFTQGTKTYVFELWEQYGGRLPDTLVLPLGNGTLVLGAFIGSRELLKQGLIERLPAIIGVQAAGCAPLAKALSQGASEPVELVSQGTVAEGIAIARPARGRQILRAIRTTGGTIATVTDDQVRAAHAELARSGFYVEPTAAVCWAALRAGLIASRDVVIPLCGSGLKAAPPQLT